MLKQFTSHVYESLLLGKQDKILLTVSGGLDSIVMLDLFHRAGFVVGVAHANFQLRGLESDGDEQLVKQLCGEKSIPFFSKRFETEAYSTLNKVSIQMAARALRYEWFEQLAIAFDYQWIATAHHLNDNIETVLFNWTHAASIRGMAGIAERNGKIIRPLLLFKKEDLQAYAQAQSLRWREDSSNESDDYSRNFIRHQIVPRLKEINPSLEDTFARAQRKIQSDLALLDQAYISWKQEGVAYQEDKCLIEKGSLKSRPVALSLLYRLLVDYGFNFDNCEQIVSCLDGQPGTKFLSLSHCLVIDRDALILYPLEVPNAAVLIDAKQEVAVKGSMQLTIRETNDLTPNGSHISVKVDADKLTFPLRWRSWKAGDFFYPLGMGQRKKISDLLIDNKVPLPDKEKLTVLESGGDIVWVIGQRLDHRFRLTADTKRALQLSLQSHFS